MNQKEVYNKWINKITCAYKKDVKIDAEGRDKITALRTQKREEYLFKGFPNEELILIECPPDVLAIEFDHTTREQSQKYIEQTKQKAQELGLQYCIASHEGQSPYFYSFNLEGLPEGQESQAKKIIAEQIVPKEAIEKKYLDTTNLGGTLIPVIETPHWKKKYNGNIHKIIEGTPPLQQKNNITHLIKNLPPKIQKNKENIIIDPIIQEIKKHIKISEIIQLCGGKIITDKMALCPLHHDTHSSVSYDDEKGLWKCHAEGKGGDVFNLVMEYDKIDFPTAKQKLMVMAGIQLPKQKTQKTKNKQSSEKDPDEQVYQQTPTFILKEKLYDTIVEGGITKFIHLDQNDKPIIETFVLDESDIKITPPQGEEVSLGAVILPTNVEEYNTTEELILQIKNFIKKYCDLSESMLEIAAHYTLLASSYDRLNQITYIRFLGDFGTGKTRAQDCIAFLIPRCIMTQGATSSAALFRIVSKWKSTVAIDEGDYAQSDEKADISKFFNSGFEKGRCVIKCDSTDPDKLRFFDPFCPKIITSRKRFEDQATESRCLTEVMRETKRTDIPPVLPNIFRTEAQSIRNKLLLWRLRNWQKINPDEAISIKFNDVEPRLKQAAYSMNVILQQFPEVLEKFLKFISEYQNTLIEERATSFDGQIVNTLFDLSGGNAIITSKDIALELGDPKKASSIGKRLKALGLKTEPKKVDNKTQRIIVFSPDIIERLKKRYVPSVSDVNTVTNVTVEEEKVTEVTQVTSDTVPPMKCFNYKNITQFLLTQPKGCDFQTIQKRFPDQTEQNILNQLTEAMVCGEIHKPFPDQYFNT